MTEYMDLLELIAEGKVPAQFLEELPKCVIGAVSEIVYNILYGELPLSEEEKAQLSTIRTELRRLTWRMTALKVKRVIITPKLLQQILPLVRKQLM